MKIIYEKENKRKKIIAIDFDGTIVENKFPEIGKLLSNSKEIINLLYKQYYIIIWTCRTGEYLDKCIKFLNDNQINYHKINENSHELLFKTSDKIYADIYIDDRSLYFNNIDWLEIYELINKKFKIETI